jgi:hypothetical protein
MRRIGRCECELLSTDEAPRRKSGAILDAAVRPEGRLKMGSALVEIFRPFGGVDLDIERDRTPVKPATFE